jgi:uncharacterized protein (DUF2237 family)
MKNAEFKDQVLQIQKQIGKNRNGYVQTASLAAATFGFCTEVTKEYVQIELTVGCDLTKINFLKRAGYFDYRGARYFITLKKSDK